jgi:hypothetical protein
MSVRARNLCPSHLAKLEECIGKSCPLFSLTRTIVTVVEIFEGEERALLLRRRFGVRDRRSNLFS